MDFIEREIGDVNTRKFLKGGAAATDLTITQKIRKMESLRPLRQSVYLGTRREARKKNSQNPISNIFL